MDPLIYEPLITHLEQFVTCNKRDKITQILKHRTRYVTLVLEDIYQPQNASATLRTSECLGIQDIYIIENLNRYRVNPDVVLGAAKWLTLHRFNQKDQNNTPDCLQMLREKGYSLVATSPETGGIKLEDIPLDRPLAFLFGNEENGLTQEAFETTDMRLRLPMYGFTQSYNISVSVAIMLSNIITRLQNSEITWLLTDVEKRELTLEWYRLIVDRSDVIERVFLDNFEW